jgi:hypothetical protein
MNLGDLSRTRFPGVSWPEGRRDDPETNLDLPACDQWRELRNEAARCQTPIIEPSVRVGRVSAFHNGGASTKRPEGRILRAVVPRCHNKRGTSGYEYSPVLSWTVSLVHRSNEPLRERGSHRDLSGKRAVRCWDPLHMSPQATVPVLSAAAAWARGRPWNLGLHGFRSARCLLKHSSAREERCNDVAARKGFADSDYAEKSGGARKTTRRRAGILVVRSRHTFAAVCV